MDFATACKEQIAEGEQYRDLYRSGGWRGGSNTFHDYVKSKLATNFTLLSKGLVASSATHQTIAFSRQRALARVMFWNNPWLEGYDKEEIQLHRTHLTEVIRACENALPEEYRFGDLLDHATDKQLAHLARYHEPVGSRTLEDNSCDVPKFRALKAVTLEVDTSSLPPPLTQHWATNRSIVQTLWAPTSDTGGDSVTLTLTGPGPITITTNVDGRSITIGQANTVTNTPTDAGASTVMFENP